MDDLHANQKKISCYDHYDRKYDYDHKLTFGYLWPVIRWYEVPHI